jgi:hypothetical protein
MAAYMNTTVNFNITYIDVSFILSRVSWTIHKVVSLRQPGGEIQVLITFKFHSEAKLSRVLYGKVKGKGIVFLAFF